MTAASNAPAANGSASAAAGGRGRELARRRVDAHDRDAVSGHPPRHLPLAAADVEGEPRRGEVPVDEREDLLLVLGVDAVGEVALPPAGVGLPRAG